MKRPNFFIIGAPKCGTTSLYRYLSAHPNVFMPREHKEPHFFASDLYYEWWWRKDSAHGRDEEDYLRLFAQAATECTRVGEASVFYLYSEVAVQKILRFEPGAKIIVMLRDPVDMFLSLHQQMLANQWEVERDPERAWHLQSTRLRGESLPKLCDDPKLLSYGAICSLGNQMRRLLETVPCEQVHTVFFEDFVRDTRVTFLDVLEFLHLPHEGPSDFPSHNAASMPPWPRVSYMHKLVDRTLRRREFRFARAVLTPLKPLSRAVRHVPQIPVTKAEVRPEFRRLLSEYFRGEVELFERVLGRQLSLWYGPGPA